ncbi:MAG TPA: replication-associated recombination protein A [Polyangiaceae bacterium]|nr:replication-associated recombination protein A [Polyangiaceae bacterium]
MARRAPAPLPSLFAAASAPGAVPLAERVRPTRLEDYVGQEHLFAPGKPLARAIANDRVPSMVLWGPPGVGKTSLGRVIAARTQATFVLFSAVLGSLAELREIVARAKEDQAYRGARTLVFVDEIHRFNKAQQDAFLPHVEAGTLTLVGATTENPAFAVNAALLSRCKVVRLEPLTEASLVALLERALREPTGLGDRGLAAGPEVLAAIAKSARGDARRALSVLESIAEDALARGKTALDLTDLVEFDERAPLLHDKSGDAHYDVTSAFIKSMRGSDPDAAVYYLMRLVEAGDDPLFLLRRMLIFASEDVGNADPRALVVVTSADAAFRRLGLPEGLYPLAHAALYLACAPKSASVGRAFARARALIEEHGALPVPKRLRNPVSALARAEGHGEGYRDPHGEGAGAGESYLPDALAGEPLYEPTSHGEEARMAARVAALRAARQGQ